MVFACPSFVLAHLCTIFLFLLSHGVLKPLGMCYSFLLTFSWSRALKGTRAGRGVLRSPFEGFVATKN